MSVNRAVPNLYFDDVELARDFYADLFGLEIAMDMGWIATLRSQRSAAPQLSVFGRATAPGPQPAVSIEVDDVDDLHRRALERGVEIVYSLRDEDWGVRRFMLADPGGNVVNVLAHR